VRRLLDPWSGASALFEDNPVFVDQLGRHHQWLAALGSHGSSANNHVIAEAAGQFVAATAFPLFRDSGAWQAAAAAELATELDAQTFPEGLNRELASDYHGLVLELGLVAWLEAALVDHPVRDRLLEPLGRAVDALHAVVDETGEPHRQGDSDDASGWLLDPIGYERWPALLRTGALVVEPAPWWSFSGPPNDVRGAMIERCLAGRHVPSEPMGRSGQRPGLFPNAGLSLLRSAAEPSAGQDELWVMFDHGPLGFLSTAAHGHADALAVEVRCGGVEIVADPGTYCYHGEPGWRDHFRSTRAHATVTVGDRNQSEIAGPFLWTAKADSTLLGHAGLGGGGGVATVEANHDGYADLGLIHRRRVDLDPVGRTITLTDHLDA
ncbi:MAG: alginate lyase family protein, partial [Actinomycetota bacterium]